MGEWADGSWQELARIDNLRHATQSRTEWVNRVLLRAVVIAETSEEHGKIIS